jgi:Domain of unknown function (DUF4900)
MMSVLGMVLVLTLFAALIMFVAGKETALSGIRSQGAQSLYVAEGGAVAGRAALMAYLNIYPSGTTTVDPNLLPSTVNGWYANGANNSQNPLAILNSLQTDGQQLYFGVNPATANLQVNWGLAYNHLKLQTSGTPVNTLGAGTYTATVALAPVATADSSCTGGPCAMHQLGPNFYEIFYNYTVTSIGSYGPKSRREITLQGNFSLQLHLQNFAIYALFTNTHTTPGGSPVWFTNTTSFNGPVHTNDQFRFLQFPTFTGTLESVNNTAWFYNNGSNVQLAANSNVSGGTRIDAPLVPPASNPQSAAPAAFSRGVPTVSLPTGPYNQQGVSIGLNPGQTSPVTTAQIAAAVPELKNASSIPSGIYVPITDSNGNCVSDPNEPMLGGIYVQGNLDSLTMSLGGGSNNLAVYTFTQGSTTTTVTVDRTNNQTTVNSNNWLSPPVAPGCALSPGPATRTFSGVPKGYQVPGNNYGTIIYVAGSINSLSGTLQQNEQTTITASGDIVIQGNVQYQTPPDPTSSSSNPNNLLGLYSSGGNIVIGASAPNNVTIHAVLMAGSTSSTASQIYVANYNTGSSRGTATVLGGLIQQYYGPFGTVNGQGAQQTGYGRNFTYDTRMSRGFSPPYFPTTTQFVVNQGSQPLTNVKPTWREVTPP